VFLFLSALCLGQAPPPQLIGDNYTTTTAYTVINNLGNCVTHNCFLLNNNKDTGGTISLTQVTSGLDGYTVGVTSTGSVYQLPFAVSGGPLWTSQSVYGTGNQQIAFHTQAEVYALRANSNCPGSYGMYRWNSGWASIHQCASSSLSISPNNVLTAITSAGVLVYSTNPTDPTPTWSSLSSGQWSQVSVFGVSVAFGLGFNTHSLYNINLSTGAFSLFTGAPTASAVKATGDGYLFLLSATPGPNGNVYYLNLFAQSPTWVNLTGTFTGLGGLTGDTFFALNNTTPYHFLLTALQATTIASGNYICPPGGCPPGAYHTITATTSFPGGYFSGGHSSAAGAPADVISASYFDIAGGCDLIYGDPNDPTCTSAGTGEVDCSQMGNVYSGGGGGNIILFEIAYTRVQATGGPRGSCTPVGGALYCAYPVRNWCTPSTTPPDNDYTGRTVSDRTIYGYWETFTPGVSILGGPWEFANGQAWGTNAPLDYANCTRSN
jgi:hypothetical protein